MSSLDGLLPYLPVAVWTAAGIGLAASYRGPAARTVLRLAALFLALWALVATTALLWVVRHGGWGALAALVAQPTLLFAPSDASLWLFGGLVAFGLLTLAFAINQAVGHGLVRSLRPSPLAWPAGLPSAGTSTRLARFASEGLDAFSFTLLARPAGRRWPVRSEVILISEGLLRRLTPEELRAVVAHELGHLVALDSRYLTYLRTAARLLRWDPFFALLSAALTRREELRADRIAAGWTGRPDALARALEKAATPDWGAASLPATRGLLGERYADPARSLLAERLRRLRAMAATSEAA